MSPAVALIKRTVDIVWALLTLLLTFWLFPLIAIAVKLDSPGPVLYRARRARRLPTNLADNSIGEFEMLQFRTMQVDMDRYAGAVFSMKQDPRVARTGRYLRWSGLDSLPTLFNVLVGDMSVFGPRPERPELAQSLCHAIPFYRERLAGVRPGLTGLAQVQLSYVAALPTDAFLTSSFEQSGSNPFSSDDVEGAVADDIRAKVLYDLAYAAGLQSVSAFLRTEAEIAFRTPFALLRASGR